MPNEDTEVLNVTSPTDRLLAELLHEFQEERKARRAEYRENEERRENLRSHQLNQRQARLRIEPPIFNERIPFDRFESDLLRYLYDNDVCEDAARKTILIQFLDHKIQDIAYTIDFNGRMSFNDLIQCLRSRYGLETKQPLARQELNHIQQEKYESIIQFADRVRYTAGIAYPQNARLASLRRPSTTSTQSLQAESSFQEDIAIDKFLMGLNNPEISKSIGITQNRNDSFDDIVTRALQIESYLQREKQTRESHIDIDELASKLKDKLQLGKEKDQYRPHQPPFRPSFCDFCHGKHKTRDCFQMKKAQQESRYPQVHHRYQERPFFQPNKVTSSPQHDFRRIHKPQEFQRNTMNSPQQRYPNDETTHNPRNSIKCFNCNGPHLRKHCPENLNSTSRSGLKTADRL